MAETEKKLTLETSNATLSAAEARAASIAAGEYVAIAVTDTGSRMTPDLVGKVFDPFFTTKTTGTGLGISQVYGFVKQSGGHVKITSVVGAGTTVTIFLPRYLGSQEEPVATAATPTPVAAAGKTILVVEDEPAVRRLTVQSLADIGYAVVEAESAERALEILETHPGFTLMFTDVVMPGMNGHQLAQEAAKRRPGLKVLYTTGYTRDAVVKNDVLDPGVKLLHKPFTLDALAHAIRKAIDAT